MSQRYKPPYSTEELQQRYNAGERDFTKSEFVEETVFKNLNLAGADFTRSWMHTCEFYNCNLRDVKFETTITKCCIFSNCDLRGATFENSAICGADFEDCEMAGSNFTDCGWYGHNLTTEEFLNAMKKNNRVD